MHARGLGPYGLSHLTGHSECVTEWDEKFLWQTGGISAVLKLLRWVHIILLRSLLYAWAVKLVRFSRTSPQEQCGERTRLIY